MIYKEVHKFFATLVICLGFSSPSLALDTPLGSVKSNLYPDMPNFDAAVTEAMQFGPGIWVSPGMNVLTDKVFSASHFPPEGNPLDKSAFQFGGGMAVADQVNLMNTLLQTNSPLLGVLVNFGQSPPEIPLKLVYSPIDLNLSSPIVPPMRNIKNTIFLGLFNNNAFDSGGGNITQNWAKYYGAMFNILNVGTGMKISGQSRGAFFLMQLNDALSKPAAQQNSYLRQVYWRHNQAFASFRAIGLNPMWMSGYPKEEPIFYYSPALTGDYLVSSISKFLYREGQKQLDEKDLGLHELGLVNKVFAASLSYEGGLVNSRYAPIDPSCRYPDANGSCGAIPDVILKNIYPDWAELQKGENNYKINFGVASEYVIVYDVLKYLFRSPAAAEQAAQKIATTGDISDLRTAVLNTTGHAYPNDFNDTFQIAKIIFERAYDRWNALTPVRGGSMLLAPRPSAALIAAAAIAGKRVDPVFWGQLAEAEQALFKNLQLRNQYGNWAKSIFGPKDPYFTDYGLSLSDLASFRKQGVTAPGTFDGKALSQFLKSARDQNPVAPRFAYVRGPDGLMGLNTENYNINAGHISNLYSGYIAPTQFPNSFIEAIASQRPIIDGRLIFYPNGKYFPFDTDNSLLQPADMTDFEKAVVFSYLKQAADFPKALNTYFQFQIPTAAAVYKLTTGQFKPLNPNASDSRIFQPALQFWLVTSEKLNATGFQRMAGYNPPQLGNLSIEFRKRRNYQIASFDSVELVDSSTPANPWPLNPLTDTAPLANAFPLDGFKTKFIANDWPNYTVLLYNNSVKYPFLYGTNQYLYLSPSIGQTYEAPWVVPIPANGNDVASGQGSLLCQLLKKYEGDPGAPNYPGYPMRDMSVLCP